MTSGSSKIRYAYSLLVILFLFSCAGGNQLKNHEFKTVRHFVDSGGDVNRQDRKGRTPLMRACSDGEFASAKYLLDNGADVTLVDKGGHSALEYALESGHISCAELLLANGASLESKNKWDMTPLMQAARFGPSCAVEFLIQKGADVNSINARGYSALTYAALRENYRSIRILLNSGADASITDSNGSTILDVVANRLGINRPYTSPSPGYVGGGLKGAAVTGVISGFLSAAASPEDNRPRLEALRRALVFGIHQISMCESESDQSNFLKKLRNLLSTLRKKGFYFDKNIAENKLTTAVKFYSIPEESNVLAMIDLTIFGSAKEGIAICDNGLYWNSMKGPDNINWKDFAKADLYPIFGYDVNIGNKAYISTAGSDFKRPDLLLLLSEIQNLYLYCLKSH